MRPVRLKGLIAAYNEVRRALASGIPIERHEGFRSRVRGLVADVERLCAEAGATTRSLPAPTHNAYAFLKNLDLDSLPEPSGADPLSRSRVPAIRNVSANVDFLCRRMWKAAREPGGNPAEVTAIRAEVRRNAEAIDRICAANRVLPAELPPATRQPYCWLRFLSEPGNVEAHLRALERASSAADGVRPYARVPVIVHLVNMTYLWKRKPFADAHLLKINEGFIHGSDALWQEMMRYVFPPHAQPEPSARDAVHDYSLGEPFRQVTLALEAYVAQTASSARGVVHDLAASFERVNAAYFGGTMQRPFLRWGRSLPSLKFGHYEHSRDTVMLSATLDSAEVPEFVVDNVMYHELLHKLHGMELANGRRLSHTREFSADAHRFARFEEAESFLKRLATRLYGRPVR